MTNDRRNFIRKMGLGFAATTVAAKGLASCAEADAASNSENLFVTDRNHPEPASMGYDRLPLEWYKQTVQRLKDKLSGIDAILLESDKNKVYFNGCFRGSGERTTWLLFPTAKKDTAYWYGPGIDRDLITSWWCTEFEYYFCYPHGKGGYPNKGQVVNGEQVDLFEWMLEGLTKREMDGKTIGTDWEMSPAQLAKAKKILPNASFVNISNDCLQMRIIKTPEEIALTQRAYRYFDKIHAFSRDFVLEHGTNTTDFEIGHALQAYGIQLMMADVKYDGKPHSAVGIESTSHYVRAGVSTAYPHPNQFFYNPVRKGEPLYINTDIRLGGMGGEGYRNYLIDPWTDQQDKIWQVVAETVQIMVEECKPGVPCSEVAVKIHEHQVKNGMQDFIYHRPAHGAGQHIEGHQAPFISLGDHTPIEAGMMFSVEPGLYDEKNGVGINPSDSLLITDDGAVLMSRIPFSKEWSYLKL
ncbi:MAG: Xaa-Pro peptidase family protein [Cyclobacteriaceae bacterium]